ncbi:B9 domain containing 2 [Homo sapiens]|uniref:B9 domain containing 2 n=1 Tax=Homo sapiens TaxID=9606 RepID=M0QY88_HUMAN|nr:B9 domain containing 2 [Homo sapiens]
MAEVHVIGQIIGASGFSESSLFCKWGIHTETGSRYVAQAGLELLRSNRPPTSASQSARIKNGRHGSSCQACGRAKRKWTPRR